MRPVQSLDKNKRGMGHQIAQQKSDLKRAVELDSHDQLDYPEPKRDLKRVVELDSHSQLDYPESEPRDYPEPRRDLKRAVELDSHSQVDYPEPRRPEEGSGAGLSQSGGLPRAQET